MARRRNPLERVRGICLDLPDTSEKEAWQRPTFRVRTKMFVMYMDNHHDDGRLAMWIKALPESQEMLVDADPERFFVPPYMGPSGWIGLRLDRKPDWDELAELVEDGYRLAAPKKLIAVLDQE